MTNLGQTSIQSCHPGKCSAAAGQRGRAHSLFAKHAAVTVDPLLPPQPTSMTLQHDKQPINDVTAGV